MQASLDILTDGSEYSGGPAIFLTLRKSISKIEEEQCSEGPILARYNLSGLPSLTGRLAADQSFQLLSAGRFRCVLLPSLKSGGGLASLFLSLVQYGYKVANPTGGSDSESSIEKIPHTTMAFGDISIIGPKNTSVLVDGILDTLFGSTRKRPSIRVCDVPSSNEDERWWDVYQDSYVRIWAQTVGNVCDCFKCNSSEKKRKRIDSASFRNANDCVSTDVHVVFVMMVKLDLQTKGNDRNKSDSISFAILPHDRYSASQCQQCGQTKTCNTRVWEALRNIPQEIIDATNGRQDKQTYHLDFIIHLDPVSSDELSAGNKVVDPHVALKNNGDQRKVHIPKWVIESKLTRHHLATFPDRFKGRTDAGILIRAQHRTLLLNKSLPFAFPMGQGDVGRANVQYNMLEDGEWIDCFHLQSCSSIVVNRSHQPFCFVSRIGTIRMRCSKDLVCGSAPILDSKVISLLKHEYTNTNIDNGEIERAAKDDNEIDLDDVENDTSEEPQRNHRMELGQNYLDTTSPYLLLLGTGCATPSPLRGSSSYALFMPTTLQSERTYDNHLVLTAIIECGEGSLTSLSRYLITSNSAGGRSLSLEEQLGWVQLIWISHSHLDHYGDLPEVVQAIIASKSKRGVLAHPLIIIAPSKVLKFLSVMIGSSASAPHHSNGHTYVGVSHREFQSHRFASRRSMLLEYVLSIPSSFQLENVGSREAVRSCEQVYCPFLSVRNVEVEHCRDAFALILELRVPLKSKSEQPFVLCFSGDTRPSDNLVQACRRSNSPLQLTSSYWQSTSVPPPPPPRVALLIHEATFMHDENGIQDAEKKRHSTATEALNIAEQIQARSCLLTHFSQRYMHVSISDVCINSTPNHNSFDWGIGVDGMVVPLTKHVTAILHQLSRCVDSIVMQTLRHQDENK